MKDIVLKAVIGVLLTALWGFFVGFVKSAYKKQKATDDGLRSLLRADMIRTYEKAAEKGYAPIYIRDSFEDCFESYVALGGNGVITDIHTKLLNLPTERK